jgi:hypothetical protein
MFFKIDQEFHERVDTELQQWQREQQQQEQQQLCSLGPQI